MCWQPIERRQQGLGIGKALGRVLGQQATKNFLIAAVLDRQLRQRLGQMRQCRRQCVVAAVWQLANQHLVKHHTQGIEIGAAVDVLATRLLRAHVARGANSETGLGELGPVIQRLGDAEVRQHRSAIGAKENVGRFHITVHQALGMGVAQG
ncbi:hypothetical protein D3C79_834050 [compost metagenome]